MWLIGKDFGEFLTDSFTIRLGESLNTPDAMNRYYSYRDAPTMRLNYPFMFRDPLITYEISAHSKFVLDKNETSW
jgi:hypothetical protein